MNASPPMSQGSFVEKLNARLVREAGVADQHLAAAAQRTAKAMHEEVEGSVLARIYLTRPYGLAPADVRRFAESLATSKGVAGLLADATPVLCLLGTAGLRAEWNDRTLSRGHLGIPLVTDQFVQEIPMVFNLLRDLGVPLAWIRGEGAPGTKTDSLGSFARYFHVAEASEARDDLGRRIIPAADFVSQYGVRSVVGCGSFYFGTDTFVTFIQFLGQGVAPEAAAQFAPLATSFAARTVKLLSSGRIFS